MTTMKNNTQVFVIRTIQVGGRKLRDPERARISQWRIPRRMPPRQLSRREGSYESQVSLDCSASVGCTYVAGCGGSQQLKYSAQRSSKHQPSTSWNIGARQLPRSITANVLGDSSHAGVTWSCTPATRPALAARSVRHYTERDQPPLSASANSGRQRDHHRNVRRRILRHSRRERKHLDFRWSLRQLTRFT